MSRVAAGGWERSSTLTGHSQDGSSSDTHGLDTMGAAVRCCSGVEVVGLEIVVDRVPDKDLAGQDVSHRGLSLLERQLLTTGPAAVLDSIAKPGFRGGFHPLGQGGRTKRWVYRALLLPELVWPDPRYEGPVVGHLLHLHTARLSERKNEAGAGQLTLVTACTGKVGGRGSKQRTGRTWQSRRVLPVAPQTSAIRATIERLPSCPTPTISQSIDTHCFACSSPITSDSEPNCTSSGAVSLTTTRSTVLIIFHRDGSPVCKMAVLLH